MPIKYYQGQQDLQAHLEHRGPLEYKELLEYRVPQGCRVLQGYRVPQEYRVPLEYREPQEYRELRVPKVQPVPRVQQATKGHLEKMEAMTAMVPMVIQDPAAATTSDSKTCLLSTTPTELFFNLSKPLLWRVQGKLLTQVYQRGQLCPQNAWCWRSCCWSGCCRRPWRCSAHKPRTCLG